MKTRVTSNSALRPYLLFLFPCLLVIGAAAPQLCLQLLKSLGWIFFLILLFINFSPLRKLTPATNSNTHCSFSHWLAHCLLLQVACYILLFNLLTLIAQINPDLPARLTNSVLITQINYSIVFPWGLYAVLLTGYRFLPATHAPTYSELFLPLLKRPPKVLHLHADLVSRLNSVFAMSITLFSLAIGVFNYFPNPWLTQITVGLTAKQLIIASLIIFYCNSQHCKRWISQHLKRNTAFGLLLMQFTLGISFFLCISSGLTNLLNPTIAKHLTTNNPWFYDPGLEQATFAMLPWLWWLGITRLANGYLAKFSTDLGILQISLGILLFPACLTGLSYWHPGWLATLAHAAMHQTALMLVLHLVSCVAFFIFFLWQPKVRWLLFGGELDNTAYRKVRRHSQTQFIIILGFTIATLLLGLRPLLLFVGMILLNELLLVVSCSGVVYSLYQIIHRSKLDQPLPRAE